MSVEGKRRRLEKGGDSEDEDLAYSAVEKRQLKAEKGNRIKRRRRRKFAGEMGTIGLTSKEGGLEKQPGRVQSASMQTRRPFLVDSSSDEGVAELVPIFKQDHSVGKSCSEKAPEVQRCGEGELEVKLPHNDGDDPDDSEVAQKHTDSLGEKSNKPCGRPRKNSPDGIKRPRGRPRKNPPEAIKRPRGRPRKNSPDGIKRPRGSPRKKSPDGIKRPRGRPRKNSPDGIKRPRGRPRKKPLLVLDQPNHNQLQGEGKLPAANVLYVSCVANSQIHKLHIKSLFTFAVSTVNYVDSEVLVHNSFTFYKCITVTTVLAPSLPLPSAFPSPLPSSPALPSPSLPLPPLTRLWLPALNLKQ